MAASSSATPFNEGVFFASQDCASLSTRIYADVIDFVVIWLAWIIGVALAVVTGHVYYESMFWWLLFVYLYLTVLKVSPVRTLGFRLTGVKVLTLRGERPSILRMSFRLLLWFLGPFNWFYDLLWLSGDECQQTLRDKIAGTYVVKQNAIPLGRGPIRLKRLFCWGMNFACLEVKKPEAAPTGSAPST
jgi:uncharacterized RDD family membrane protein YckC